MPSPATTQRPPTDTKPERRWTAAQLSAVVEAAYVLEALQR
ncbi:MAG TPA: hypothetical protein VKG89_03775 [Solirubrobacterales bacterium]|nr:hypothetical protein [Solirubrobacterales bacterium]